jgi:hypothetical protein
VEKKLKISNPEKINSKNICLDKSTVEITYMGYEAHTNASDNKPYTLYRFSGSKNSSFINNVVFEIHTNITDNKVQFNIWDKNASMQFSSLSVDVIRDRNELINRMIAEIKKS